MSGGALLGLVLLSMAWLFFLAGTLLNVAALVRSFRARKPPSLPIPLLPGVAGSLAAFFSIPAVTRYGIEPAWPWFWVLLPLLIDALGTLAALARRSRSKSP